MDQLEVLTRLDSNDMADVIERFKVFDQKIEQIRDLIDRTANKLYRLPDNEVAIFEEAIES